MIRNKIKEALRPIVKEALSDYLKDSEQDLRALQNAHPQLDIKKDLPSETGAFPKREGKINEGVEIEWYGRTAVVPDVPESVDAYSLLRYCDNVEHEGGNQYRFDNVDPRLKQKFIDAINGKKVKEEKLTEAPSTKYGVTDLAKELKQKFGGEAEAHFKIAGPNIYLNGVSDKKNEIYKWLTAKFKELGARETKMKEQPIGTMIYPRPFGVIVYLVKDKTVKEASTTSAVAGYETPYAFSDVGLDKDVKKRKIAQQLGYKLVGKNRLKEEVRVNVAKAVPLLTEEFRPQLKTPIANALYMKMLDYLLMSADPQYRTIHKFRVAIDKVPDAQDKAQLIRAFNEEFKINWGTASQSAWEYYKNVD